MKKRMFLIVLPALMALSACSGVQVNKRVDLMAEDTLAHEEIFGAAEEFNGSVLQRVAPLKLSALDSDFVKIGYQIKFAENGSGTSDDTISIRFVAAIKDAGVTAFWHRGFAQPNSYEGAAPDGQNWKYKLDDGSVNESKTIYSSLVNGDSTITARSGDYQDYAGFVIYTLRNIPYEAYKDSYLGAYLVLADAENGSNSVKSDFLAVKVEKADSSTSKNAFAVDLSEYDNKHFLQGTINGSTKPTTYLEDNATLDGDNNFASYTDVELKSNDSFGSFYLNSSSHFMFFGHDSFFSESSAFFDESASLADYNKPKTNGTYSLFISKGEGKQNHVYTVQEGPTQIFTATDLPSWLSNAEAVLIAHIERVNHVWIWANVSLSGASATFSAANNILKFEILRCAKGTTTPNWDLHSGNDAGRIYNRSGEKTVNSGVYSYSIPDSSWSSY